MRAYASVREGGFLGSIVTAGGSKTPRDPSGGARFEFTAVSALAGSQSAYRARLREEAILLETHNP
jgi:hypothetical protein